MKSVLKFVLLILFLICGFAVMAVYLTFFKPLPNYNKDVRVAGLQNEVTIHRDGYGVPYIFADNKNDLYFALGYAHAQDRIWQMTISQMMAEGRFAEFLGDKYIEADRYLRMLGFMATAETIWEQLSQEDKQILDSYSAGVNAFAASNQNRLPIEFSLTSTTTIPWLPQHSIALTRMMAWEMNTGWWNKVVMAYLHATITEEDFSILFPGLTINDNELEGNFAGSLINLLDIDRDFRRLFGNQDDAVGGSAWVVNGSQTESGYPLLAGDLHLATNMPARWFEVHLNLNGRNSSGATMPGAPAILVGQNDSFAWSLTNIMADGTDFFIEKINPDQHDQVLTDSLDNEPVFEQIRTDRSAIKVRNGNEVISEVRYTRNGRVVSDNQHSTTLPDNHLITMRWIGHQPSNEIGTLIGINWAENFNEFQSYLPDFKVPGLNIIYGDTEGNIALFVLGNYPQRDNPLGLRRGWMPVDDWKGSIPFNQLPHVINPQKGWIASANNQAHHNNSSNYITGFGGSTSRFERLQDLLTDQQNLNINDFKNMQNDIHSNHAREVTRLILPILYNNQDDVKIQMAVSYLANWDYNYAMNAAAATIFDTFFIKLGVNTIKEYLGDDIYQSFLKTEFLSVSTLMNVLNRGIYDTETNRPDHIHISEANIIKSMQQAITHLEESLGSRSYEWRWENLHTVTFKPPLFSQEANQENSGRSNRLIVKNVLSRGPYPVTGNGMTLKKGKYSIEEPFEMTYGSSYRRIVDLSDLTQSHSVLSTGQSGNPISTHYDDQIQLWLNGQYRIFNHHQNQVSSYTSRMKLRPN